MDSPDNWSVVTRYFPLTKEQKRQGLQPKVKHHELLFGSKTQPTKRGQDGFNSLVEMSKFLNRRKLVPRDRIECAADAPNPEKYLRSITL